MKKLLFIFALFYTFNAAALDDYYWGKVFLLSGDTINAEVSLSYTDNNFIKNFYIYNHAGHYLEKKSRIRMFNPNKINGFQIPLHGKIHTFLSFPTDSIHFEYDFFYVETNPTAAVRLCYYYNLKNVLNNLGGVVGSVTSKVSYEKNKNRRYIIEHNGKILYLDKIETDLTEAILNFLPEFDVVMSTRKVYMTDLPMLIEQYNNYISTK
jgi:hypothetical protein